MKTIINILGKLFIVTAIIFLIIHSQIRISNGNRITDILGFIIPNPPLPELVSIHGLVGAIVFVLLLGIGINLNNFGSKKLIITLLFLSLFTSAHTANADIKEDYLNLSMLGKEMERFSDEYANTKYRTFNISNHAEVKDATILRQADKWLMITIEYLKSVQCMLSMADTPNAVQVIKKYVDRRIEKIQDSINLLESQKIIISNHSMIKDYEQYISAIKESKKLLTTISQDL